MTDEVKGFLLLLLVLGALWGGAMWMEHVARPLHVPPNNPNVQPCKPDEPCRPNRWP